MRRVFILVCFILSLDFMCYAQGDGFRPNIRVAYSYVGGSLEESFFIPDNNYIYSGNMLSVDADLASITSRLSMGIHVGLGQASYLESSGYFHPTMGIHYGINLSYRVLGPEVENWDVRLNGNIGSYWCPNITPQSEYGLGALVAYYPFKHIGFYGALDWGKYRIQKGHNNCVSTGNSKMSLGVSFRF